MLTKISKSIFVIIGLAIIVHATTRMKDWDMIFQIALGLVITTYPFFHYFNSNKEGKTPS